MHVFWPVSFGSVLCLTFFDTTPKMGKPVRPIYAFFGCTPTFGIGSGKSYRYVWTSSVLPLDLSTPPNPTPWRPSPDVV